MQILLTNMSNNLHNIIIRLLVDGR